MHARGRGDRARLIGRDGGGLVAQIDHDDLVADPVHLGKAWLASALMEFPELCPPYMANEADWPVWLNLCRRPPPGGEAHDISVMGRKPACVLECAVAGVPGHRDVLAERDRRTRPWRIPNEFPPLFPPCHGRAGPGRRDFAGPRPRAGAIAGAGASRRRTPAPRDARRPGRRPNASSAGQPRRRPRRTAAGPAPVQTADPFGEEITLTPKTVVVTQGHRQLGFGVRHPDRFVQDAVSAARQAGHQALRQFDDRLHLHRRYRLHAIWRKFRSIRNRRT